MLYKKTIDLLRTVNLPLKFTFEQQLEYLVAKYDGVLLNDEKLTKWILRDAIITDWCCNLDQGYDTLFLNIGRCLRWPLDHIDQDKPAACLFKLPGEVKYVTYLFSKDFPIEVDYIFMGTIVVVNDYNIEFIDDGSEQSKWAKTFHWMKTKEEKDAIFESLYDILVFFYGKPQETLLLETLKI